MPNIKEKFESIKAKTPVKMPRLPTLSSPIGMPSMPAMPAIPRVNIPTPSMPKMPNLPTISLPSPSMPKLPSMPQVTMPSVRLPQLKTPGMPSMPRLPEMRTPMKMPDLGALNPLKFDISSTVQTVKGKLPGMPLTLRDISTPMKSGMLPNLNSLKTSDQLE